MIYKDLTKTQVLKPKAGTDSFAYFLRVNSVATPIENELEIPTVGFSMEKYKVKDWFDYVDEEELNNRVINYLFTNLESIEYKENTEILIHSQSIAVSTRRGYANTIIGNFDKEQLTDMMPPETNFVSYDFDDGKMILAYNGPHAYDTGAVVIMDEENNRYSIVGDQLSNYYKVLVKKT